MRMDKPLVKMYLLLVGALVLSVVFLPVVVRRTSAWAGEAVTRGDLLAYESHADQQPTPPPADMGKAVIVMDDGWDTQYTCGYRILKQYGFKACVAVIPATIGKQGYLSYGQLAELYKDGWDLLDHTYNHRNLLALSEAEQRRQITKARGWLHAHLFYRGSNIVVYPQGKFSGAITELIKDEGFTAARSLRSLWTAETGCTREDVEICNLISSMPLATAQAALDKAMRNHSAVILVLHKIEPVTDDTEMQIEETFFLDIVKYMDAHRKDMDVVTMTGLLAVE
jgi:peptidoglycan/xylan/chitin deacetylase (PgdA/CDA1 family)